MTDACSFKISRGIDFLILASSSSTSITSLVSFTTFAIYPPNLFYQNKKEREVSYPPLNWK
jgi:hypothetical protein